ncbi:hypothetical protein CONLIGDRAFT_693921 [Coniochaeta ligniaria NRRL 30616]|uniref:Uncharacterized protein n=1 Tax=Coniochaeta ligniaria NRRL 30616 TaxID=1408157 RepID=A0A1J7I7F5_9PEZI|nr:hypothetical protein CONLIGDRAFT_693921 [Coniochaeta ligniaria NRRL 30616]
MADQSNSSLFVTSPNSLLAPSGTTTGKGRATAPLPQAAETGTITGEGTTSGPDTVAAAVPATGTITGDSTTTSGPDTATATAASNAGPTTASGPSTGPVAAATVTPAPPTGRILRSGRSLSYIGTPSPRATPTSRPTRPTPTTRRPHPTGPTSDPDYVSSDEEMPQSRPRQARRPILRLRPAQAPTPQQPAAQPLLTARALPTRMPERDGDWLASVRDVSDEAKRSTTDVQAKWDRCVGKFWELGRDRFEAGEVEVGGRSTTWDACVHVRPTIAPDAAATGDVRDFCAVATRIFDPILLDLSLSVAYSHLPAKIDSLERKMLKATIDSTRRAIENSLRAPAGANKSQDFPKWRLFWWFGDEISTNVSMLQKISAALNASRKTRRVSFEELTNLLWRKVFAKRGDSEKFPSPTLRDMGEVYAELVEAKVKADEDARQARADVAARRAAIDRAKEERQQRDAAAETEKARGRKRTSRDMFGDDLDDDDLYNVSPRPDKRPRRTAEEAEIEAQLSWDQTALAGAGDESMVHFDESLGLGGAGGEPSPAVSSRRASARSAVETGRRASAVSTVGGGGGDDLDLEELADEVRYAPRSVDSIRGWLGRMRRVDRDLAPPEDPEEIIDEDVRDLLASARSIIGVAVRMMERKVERHG